MALPASDLVYADHNGTTPCLPEVVEAVAWACGTAWGNPSSRHQLAGRTARGLIDEARQRLASTIGARDDEVIFTSGATEALNLAMIGVMERSLATRPRILIGATEHPAISACAQRIAEAGATVDVLPVDAAGRISADELNNQIDERTALVCIMHANNETGVVQDIAPLTEVAHRHGALFLCDTTQSLGKFPLDVRKLDCDFASFSSHKCNGPKGSGALYKRRGLGISAQIVGGGQEQGLRCGTENVPGIHGFSTAIDWWRQHGDVERQRLQKLRDGLESTLQQRLPGLIVWGDGTPRLPNTAMIAHPDADPGWLGRCARLALSGGSACASAQGHGSPVLRAMGAAPALAGNSLRISLGLTTTDDDLATIAETVIKGMTAMG